MHGTYHAGRAVTSGNGEEWARAKDQYSKVTRKKWWKNLSISYKVFNILSFPKYYQILCKQPSKMGHFDP